MILLDKLNFWEESPPSAPKNKAATSSVFFPVSASKPPRLELNLNTTIQLKTQFSSWTQQNPTVDKN